MGSAISTLCVAAGATIGAYLLYMSIQPIWVWKLRRFPGSPALPLFGHLLEILRSGNMTVWMDHQARKHGPIFKLWNGSMPVLVLTDVEAARKMLMNFPSRPALDFFWTLVGEEFDIAHNTLLNLPGTTRQFRVLRKAFEGAVQTPAALERHSPMLVEVAANLVKHLDRYAATGEPVDVTKVFPDMTMDAIGNAAFGLNFDCLACGPKDYTLPQGWADAPIGSPEFSRGLVAATRVMVRTSDVATSSSWKILALLLPNLYGFWCRLANWLPDASLREELTARRGATYALQRMIQQWRDSRQQQQQQQQGNGAKGSATVPKSAISDAGFLAKLLAIAESEGLNETEIISQALMMLLAGYETTASSLSYALHMLATHPDAQARAQQEVDQVVQGKEVTARDVEALPFTRAIFDEALRLCPPGDSVLRQMATPFPVDLGKGLIIPKGTSVWAHVYTLQRNPAIWPRAEEFLPERHIQPGNEALAPANPNAFLPFGLGPRMCPGYKFAQLESYLALAKLLQAYTFSPAPGKPAPKMISGIVYCPDAVWLSIAKRK